MAIRVRLAEIRDVPMLRNLIEVSVRGLQGNDYSAAQLESALGTVYGVDTQLILDGTYFAAEDVKSVEEVRLVGCGGWSQRKTLYGGDRWKKIGKKSGKQIGKQVGQQLGKQADAGGEDSLLDPATDAAKIRAFFVHPEWARRGIGGLILSACEAAAYAAGFRRLEMGATLTGAPFYLAKGYVILERDEVPLGNGLTLPIVRMGRQLLGKQMLGKQLSEAPATFKDRGSATVKPRRPQRSRIG